jgi:hypothetical protein
VLVGCHVRTYLLESVLVCRQSAEESNFHVFYQIVRGECAVLVVLCAQGAHLFRDFRFHSRYLAAGGACALLINCRVLLLSCAFAPSFYCVGSKATDRVKWGLSGDYTAYHYLCQSALKSVPSFSDDSGYTSNNTSSNNLGAVMAQAHSQAAQSAAEAASTAATVAAALEMMNSPHSQVLRAPYYQHWTPELSCLATV